MRLRSGQRPRGDRREVVDLGDHDAQAVAAAARAFDLVVEHFGEGGGVVQAGDRVDAPDLGESLDEARQARTERLDRDGQQQERGRGQRPVQRRGVDLALECDQRGAVAHEHRPDLERRAPLVEEEGRVDRDPDEEDSVRAAGLAARVDRPRDQCRHANEEGVDGPLGHPLVAEEDADRRGVGGAGEDRNRLLAVERRVRDRHRCDHGGADRGQEIHERASHHGAVPHCQEVRILARAQTEPLSQGRAQADHIR